MKVRDEAFHGFEARYHCFVVHTQNSSLCVLSGAENARARNVRPSVSPSINLFSIGYIISSSLTCENRRSEVAWNVRQVQPTRSDPEFLGSSAHHSFPHWTSKTSPSPNTLISPLPGCRAPAIMSTSVVKNHAKSAVNKAVQYKVCAS